MILYRLRCTHDHHFESWFRDSAAYDEQKARDLISCPVCGSAEVGKAIMAPALGRGTGKRDEERAAPASTPAPAAAPHGSVAPTPPVALMGEREQQLRAMLRAVREHVVKNSDYVGEEFPRLARQMHEGEAEKRAIYGEASADEVRALIEDEIEVLPLPSLPDERN